MRRKQKRWNATADIESEIDTTKSELKEIQGRAPVVEDRISELSKWLYKWEENNPNAADGKRQQYREAYLQRDSFRAELKRLQQANKRCEGRLQLLKQKWAASKTEVCEFLPDASVV